jgi:hypothetical protein
MQYTHTHAQVTMTTAYHMLLPGFKLAPVQHAQQQEDAVMGETRNNLLEAFVQNRNLQPALIEVLENDLKLPLDPRHYNNQQKLIMRTLLRRLSNIKCCNMYGGNLAEQKMKGVTALLSDFLVLFGDLYQLHNPGYKYINVDREHTLLVTEEDFRRKFPDATTRVPRSMSRNKMYTATIKFPFLVCFDSKNEEIHFRYVVRVTDNHNGNRPVNVAFNYGNLARRVERQEQQALVTVLANVTFSAQVDYNLVFE